MGKISQVANGDTGLEARNKINTALKDVEVGAEFSGTGNTGAVLTFLGRIYNALRSFYLLFDVSALTANRTLTMPDKDVDLTGIVTTKIQTLAIVGSTITLDWDNKNNLKGATVIAVSSSITIAVEPTTVANAHFASFYLNIINTPTTVLSFGQYFNSPDDNFNNTNGEFTPQEDGEYGFGIELVDGVYFLTITPPIN